MDQTDIFLSDRYNCTLKQNMKIKLALKAVNNASWVAVVAPTGRPKSVRDRFVIELFGGVFLCCRFARLTFLMVWGVFVIGLIQTSSFFSRSQ